MRRQRAHPPIRKWEAIRWSAWLAGIASALNLVFMVTFSIVFIGKMTGGLPEFIYGVPRLALALLLIPPVTGALAVAIPALSKQSATMQSKSPRPMG